MKADDNSALLKPFSGPIPVDTFSKENDVFVYIPTSKPKLMLEDGQNIGRCLEDEGLYVGKKPNVNSSNLNKLQHRLIQTDSKYA